MLVTKHSVLFPQCFVKALAVKMEELEYSNLYQKTKSWTCQN